jgi:hypothetical protein
MGFVIFTVSLALLIWGIKPLDHEIRTQPLDSSELQLPTPITFLSEPIDAVQDKPELVS